ncbi:SH3 domain-containing protein [Kaistella pullorum]|uniref:SH3 domain-containing protein n=1 Tax=Kaistella pullorum TaxID=2763074 RepID=A0ABR8WQ48_9FLAO|nr:SH3 domain-containing protein [Kaistella pullorum]MBD8019068.1 SH3 domain-containing protein [Kaistella pullorum]
MKRKLLTIIFFLTTILTFAQTEMFVNTEQLNIRSGAGSKYEVIGKLSRNEKITAISTEGKWTEIKLDNGTKGFVSTKFLSDTNEISKKEKSSNWPIILIIGGIILFSLFKKSNKGGSSNSSRMETIKQPKIAKLKLYMCSKCGDTVKQISSPKNTTTCHNKHFHSWIEIAIVGDNNYQCSKCGVTLQTENSPKNTTTCINNHFHSWTKL